MNRVDEHHKEMVRLALKVKEMMNWSGKLGLQERYEEHPDSFHDFEDVALRLAEHVQVLDENLTNEEWELPAIWQNIGTMGHAGFAALMVLDELHEARGEVHRLHEMIDEERARADRAEKALAESENEPSPAGGDPE